MRIDNVKPYKDGWRFFVDGQEGFINNPDKERNTQCPEFSPLTHELLFIELYYKEESDFMTYHKKVPFMISDNFVIKFYKFKTKR